MGSTTLRARPGRRRNGDRRRRAALRGCLYYLTLTVGDAYISPSVAGWSSLVARWAHNPKVEGSNPSPATTALIRFSFQLISTKQGACQAPCSVLRVHSPAVGGWVFSAFSAKLSVFCTCFVRGGSGTPGGRSPDSPPPGSNMGP